MLVSREPNESMGASERTAMTDPITVADPGRTGHVRLDISQYEKLPAQGSGLVEALQMNDDEDIVLTPVRFEAKVPNL